MLVHSKKYQQSQGRKKWGMGKSFGIFSLMKFSQKNHDFEDFLNCLKVFNYEN